MLKELLKTTRIIVKMVISGLVVALTTVHAQKNR